MRLRNESLPTGYLITSDAQGTQTSSLLILVAGAADIDTLQTVIELVRSNDGLIGIDVPDQRRLDALDLDIDPSRIIRIEAHELMHLNPTNLKLILQPAFDRLKACSNEIFPSAGAAVGAVAEGIQFLDREEDLANVMAALRIGRDVMIRAPRRAGKTSLLRAIERESRDEFEIHYLDVQRDRTLAGTAARFLASVSGQNVRASTHRVDQIGWQATFREAVERLGSDGTRKRVLLLDELVLLLDAFSSDEEERIRIAREALTGLQGVRDETGAQFVFAGSLDLLDYVREQLGMTDLPAMYSAALSYPLPPLAESCLDRQLRRLLLGSQLVLEDGDLDWLAKNFDIAVPYPGQLFLDRLTQEVRVRSSLGPAAIEDLLATFLRETDAFREFESHLDRTIPSRKTAVTNALDAIVKQPFLNGAALEDVQKKVPSDVDFTWMIETFPLLQSQSAVRCASRLWMRWWRIQAGLES